MATRLETLAANIESRFAGRLSRVASTCGELTYELPAVDLLPVCKQLRDDSEFKFEQLIDVTGVDYLQNCHGL
jgi:NADH-quinone oxidoreductase subunit C